MRFIDSNVFLHAFLRPRRELSYDERRMKEEAQRIIRLVEEGEEVATTTVHVSEVVNIVESGLGLQRSLGILAWVISKPNIQVYPATVDSYERALPVAQERGVSANDALAYLTMRDNGLAEVYTFDKHYDQLDVKRLPR
jgi:predicted nucleic acid-binding protein